LQGKSFARLDMATAQLPAQAAVSAPAPRFIEFSLQSSAAPASGAGAVKQ